MHRRKTVTSAPMRRCTVMCCLWNWSKDDVAIYIIVINSIPSNTI